MSEYGLRWLVDENIACHEQAFAGLGEVRPRPGRQIGPGDVAGADALIVRSVTPVNADLLAESSVRFVGSATIGIDHVDADWLRRQGIAFAHAPGCNANAVVDWVLAVLAELDARGRHRFGEGTVGIIGAGNVGSRVADRLGRLGHAVRVCDPPRAEREGGQGFVPLAHALDADVVSLHVPLERGGRHATAGMLDADAIAALREGAVLLNAARGGVIDERALAARLAEGPPLTVALDCWAGEPDIDGDLLARVDIATPHIAGYSLEGRLRGTAMVAAAAARHFGIAISWDWREALPAQAPPDPGDDADAIRRAYEVARDDAALRALLDRPAAQRAAGFDRLRRDYPARREFARADRTPSP